jgi:two-component system response regulator HydG
MSRILIIDDDNYICDLLVNYLKKNGYEAEGALSGSAGIKMFGKNTFDLVLCDYRLPDSDGLKMLQKLKSATPSVPVVIMTAYADIKTAVRTIKSGAFDYVTKPIQAEEILKLIEKAISKGTGSSPDPTGFREDFITGSSLQIDQVMQHVSVVAGTDIPVLLEGETGSGKEYLARAIHYASARRDQPFIPIDCGAIPKDLANSELFGHIKGSFTGAIKDKTGLFEQADKGTIFLDEVGNLPHENQVKLLRALQERIITRVGDNKAIRVDVRLITATNEDLSKQVARGVFREDLYHRINGFKINVPPLRERKKDIPVFTEHFISQANRAFNRNVRGLDQDAIDLFLSYAWHGNIRELQNVVNRAVLLTKKDKISPDVLPEEIRFSHFRESADEPGKISQTGIPDLKEATLVTEREVIIDALMKANNNKSKAAKLLNIDRKTLYNKIKQYGIRTDK